VDEQQNAIAIAEIKGNMNATRAENDAMESRIDASLARMQADMASFREDAERRDKETALRDKESIQREKENQRWIVGLVLACTAIVVGAVALL